MFADVVGSTVLYEKLGDVPARDCISECLWQMGVITRRRRGTVVETIGDEVMCQFPTADRAVQAACEIQDSIKGQGVSQGIPMSVRIGMHFGRVGTIQGHPFGDTVNVAARMAGIAVANQIITTQDLVENLSDENAALAREFDCITVKGKSNPTTMYEIVWEQEDVTYMPALNVGRASDAATLRLEYQGQQHCLTAGDKTLWIGRGEQCMLRIDDKIASRLHAEIRYRRGKFVLIDHSTNGTFVRLPNSQEIFLRREELPLLGEGVIAIGESAAAGAKHLITFAYAGIPSERQSGTP